MASDRRIFAIGRIMPHAPLTLRDGLTLGGPFTTFYAVFLSVIKSSK